MDGMNHVQKSYVHLSGGNLCNITRKNVFTHLFDEAKLKERELKQVMAFLFWDDGGGDDNMLRRVHIAIGSHLCPGTAGFEHFASG